MVIIMCDHVTLKNYSNNEAKNPALTKQEYILKYYIKSVILDFDNTL